MDLAAPEMVRVAKEAYTYQYELQLKKEQNEGELNKELAELRETLSAIQAEIATYQAQIDTARERETNRANSRARQRMVEAESSANANAALLEAQALDIRAVSGAAAPEILEYRFQQELLERLSAVADRLPRVVRVGDGAGGGVDYLEIARGMIGSGDEPLFTPEDMRAIRERMAEIQARISERGAEIDRLVSAPEGNSDGVPPAESVAQEAARVEAANAERIEEIRKSVADERIQERVEMIGEGAPDVTDSPDGEEDGR